MVLTNQMLSGRNALRGATIRCSMRIKMSRFGHKSDETENQHKKTKKMRPTDQTRRRNAGHILCVGPKDLFTEAVQTAGLLHLSLVYVNSFDRAQTELRVRSYEAVIVALESNVIGDTLFDNCVVVNGGGTEMRCSSRFLQHCVSKYPSMFRIVWSSEALEKPKFRKACFDCGADAVKATQSGLFEALFAILTPPTSTQLKQRDILTKYAPVHQRAMREEQLLTLSCGTVTKRLERLIRKTERLEEQVLAMSPLLVRTRIQSAVTTNKNNNAHDWALATAAVHNKRARLSIALQELKQAGKELRMMRVVHVSDTVGQHRTLSATLPGGNLFVHSGNFTDGNPAHAEEQLQDFLVWLETVVCPKFDQVVFIAGRNETLLDKVNCPNSALCLHAKLVLEDYLQRMHNAAYLENSSIVFEGYHIYGCPTVYDHNATTTSLSRKRTGLIMIDDDNNNNNDVPPRGAFERQFPGTLDSDACNGNIDILVTNRPLAIDGSYELPVASCMLPIAQPPCPQQKGGGGPSSSSSSKRHYPMLEKFARRKQKRQKQPTRRNPVLHAFGYDCKGFGIAVTECDSVQMNSCQTRNLRFDKNGGGTPLVVDLPTKK